MTLKTLKTSTQDFTKSDAVMGCCISTAIGLSWTPEQLEEKAAKLAGAIEAVLSMVSSVEHPLHAELV